MKPKSLRPPSRPRVKHHTCIAEVRTQPAEVQFDEYAYRKKLQSEGIQRIPLDFYGNQITTLMQLTETEIDALVIAEKERLRSEGRGRLTIHPYGYCKICGRAMSEVKVKALVKQMDNPPKETVWRDIESGTTWGNFKED